MRYVSMLKISMQNGSASAKPVTFSVTDTVPIRKLFPGKNPAGLTTGIESKVCYYFRSLFVE